MNRVNTFLHSPQWSLLLGLVMGWMSLTPITGGYEASGGACAKFQGANATACPGSGCPGTYNLCVGTGGDKNSEFAGTACGGGMECEYRDTYDCPDCD